MAIWQPPKKGKTMCLSILSPSFSPQSRPSPPLLSSSPSPPLSLSSPSSSYVQKNGLPKRCFSKRCQTHVRPVACRVATENCFSYLTDHVDFRLTDDTQFGAVNVENCLKTFFVDLGISSDFLEMVFSTFPFG